MEWGIDVNPWGSMPGVGQTRSPGQDEGLGVYLIMEDLLPMGIADPAAGAWLGVAWGSLSPTGMSRSPLVASCLDAISMLLGPGVHTLAAGVLPSLKPRACG